MTVLDPVRSEAAVTAADDAPLAARLVSGRDAVLALTAAWKALFDRAPQAWVYLSAEWLESFVRGGWLTGEAAALTVWRGERLVAALPIDIARKGPVRIARPVGAGFPSYLGVLADPAERRAIAALARLAREAGAFDLFLIDDLYSDDADTNAFLQALKGEGYAVREAVRANCHFLALPATFEDYEQAMSRKRRWRVGRDSRKLLEMGAALEFVHGPAVTDEHLARIAAIQDESWMKQRGAAVLGQDFYKQLLRRMADAGMVWLWLVTLEGEDAAFVLGLGAHRRLVYTWPAFRLKFGDTHVGRVLTGWSIRDCCGDFDHYDFGHGDGEYKVVWGNDKRLVRRAAAARTPLGRLALAAYALAWRASKVQALRDLRDRLRGTKGHAEPAAAAAAAAED